MCLDYQMKSRELRLREKQAEIDAKLRNDEFNARIIRMDDLGISPTELATLAEEVRQMRQELSQMKQEINNRTLG